MNRTQEDAVRDYRYWLHDTIVKYASEIDILDDERDEGDTAGSVRFTKQARRKMGAIASDLAYLARVIGSRSQRFTDEERLSDLEKKHMQQAVDWLMLAHAALDAVPPS